MQHFISVRLKSIKFIAFVLLMLVPTILTGCMVGPDFHSPQPPDVTTYNAHTLPKQTKSTPTAGKAGKSQVFVYNQDIRADWWRLFKSPEINRLIDMGLNNSPNLTAAMAALREAQENENAAVGNLLLPAVDAQFQAERLKFSTVSIGGVGATARNSLFNLFNASVSVTYILDLFGGSRRQIKGLIAQADYQQFQLMAAYLSLTSNIVTSAVTYASAEEQIKATKDLIRFEDLQLTILRKQYRLGGISLATVLTQQVLVDQTKATLPPLQRQSSVARHELAALMGVFPDAPIPKINLEALTLPKQIPISLPSMLVRQRPDIRASEALLHVASAQVGVATANLLPQISLSGNWGYQSAVASSLFQSSNNVWNAVTLITQPIFHGGALLATRRATIAAFEQALANYRQVVLTAFQNVADSLRAIETDSRTLYSLKNAETAAYRSLILTTNRFHLGGATYLDLLVAQQQYQQTRINRIRAQAARYTNTVALYQALGGGWWHYPCAPKLGPDGWACY